MKSSAAAWIVPLTVFFLGYVFLWTSITVSVTHSLSAAEYTENSVAAVLASLHSGSEAEFQKVLQNVKNHRQENFLRLYVAEIPKLSPSRQPVAIRLLKERDDLEFLPSTILRLAKNGTDDVRIAAVEVMELHGHGGCVPVLLEILAVTAVTDVRKDSESSPTPTLGKIRLRETATRTLNSLKGDEVNDAIVWELRNTDSRIQRLAMRQIQSRPILTAEAEVELWAIVTDNTTTDNMDNTDNKVTEDEGTNTTMSVRQFAVWTLGCIAATESLTRMTKELDRSRRSEEKNATATTKIPATDWVTAMETVARRAADPTIAIRKMLIGLDNSSLETQCDIVRMIGKLNGPYSQSVLDAAVLDDREPIRAVAMEILSQR